MCSKHCAKMGDIVFSTRRSYGEICLLEFVDLFFFFPIGLMGLCTTRLIKKTVLNDVSSVSVVDMVYRGSYCVSLIISRGPDRMFPTSPQKKVEFRIIMKTAVMTGEAPDHCDSVAIT
ncbi:hypothetical protein BDR04DRAFT_547337 [Suillus decipiens]|nr:hypothetical protein BDR04DRAFT_547337 [Suillus decipiens]